MPISARLLKIAVAVRVGGVWGDVCVIEADRLSSVAAVSGPEHDPGGRAITNNGPYMLRGSPRSGLGPRAELSSGSPRNVEGHYITTVWLVQDSEELCNVWSPGFSYNSVLWRHWGRYFIVY